MLLDKCATLALLGKSSRFKTFSRSIQKTGKHVRKQAKENSSWSRGWKDQEMTVEANTKEMYVTVSDACQIPCRILIFSYNSHKFQNSPLPADIRTPKRGKSLFYYTLLERNCISLAADTFVLRTVINHLLKTVAYTWKKYNSGWKQVSNNSKNGTKTSLIRLDLSCCVKKSLFAFYSLDNPCSSITRGDEICCI